MKSSKFYNPEQREQLIGRIAFAHYSGINVAVAEHFDELGVTPEKFLTADVGTLSQLTGLKSSVIENMRSERELDAARREADFIQENGISAIWYSDEDYPALLRQCDDAPAMLYFAGTVPAPTQHSLAIVGTRHCTTYGREFINRLVADLHNAVGSDMLIVSGLALGADIAAHRAAVREGLPTGAVMAEGLNRVYPAEHRSDAMRIIRQGGFLASEYLSSDTTHRGHFLARNRIVAGMSEATVIVESDIKGGAMVTARLAGEYRREVLALPGRVSDPYSRGCNELIATDRAHLLRDADDLIEALGWQVQRAGVQTSLQPELPPQQRATLLFMQSHAEATINDIAFALNIPIAEMTSILFELEMDGFINAIAGGRYMVTVPVT